MRHSISKGILRACRILLLLLFFTPLDLWSQDEECGFIAPSATESDVNDAFDQARAYALQKNGVITPSTIPIRFTVIRRDDGSPAYIGAPVIDQAAINDALSKLNGYFAPSGITFVQCGPVNYIHKAKIFQADQPRSFFSFASNAVDVIVGDDDGARGWASFLRSPISSSYDVNHTSLMGVRSFNELDEVLAHEMGHKLNLYHTFDGASLYDNPANPITNSPGNHNDHPIFAAQGRELVIRNDLPIGSVFFHEANHEDAGDKISDTPAWGRYSKDFPNPDIASCFIYPVDNSCTSGVSVDYNTCNYIGNYLDYNNHPLENTDVSIRNLMSYTPDHCRMEFTQGQLDHMTFINETIGVPLWWEEDLCGNLTDQVEYRDTPIPIPNVTVSITHPDGNGKHCRTTTNTAGNFHGVLFEDKVKTKVAWLGSGEALRQPVIGGPDLGYDEYNDNHYAIFEYTHEDWKAGITTADLIRIRKHILGTELLDGYDQLAADVSNSGTITTLDIIKIQSLLLGNRTEFEDIISGPWRFVPEYIPHQYTSDFHSDPFNMTIDGMSFSNEAPYVWATWEYNITNGTGGSAGFDAVKMGDVNGDGIAGMEDNCPDNVVVETSDVIPASTGETVDVLVKADGFTNVVGFQLGFKFNTQKLKLVNLSVNTNLSGFAADNVGLPKDNAVSDVLISWHDSQLSAKTLSNTELLLNVKVQAKDNITDISDYFYLDESTIEPAFYDIDGCTLPVEIEKSRANIQALNSANTGETTTPLALNTATNMETIPLPLEKTVTSPVLLSDLNCMPNPSLAGHWTVSANAREMEAQDGWLTIYDLNGAIVQQQKVAISGGINQWTIENTKLPTGIYLIELKIDAIQMRVKAVKG